MTTIAWPNPETLYGLRIVGVTTIPVPTGYGWLDCSFSGGELWLTGTTGYPSTPGSAAGARLTSKDGSWEIYTHTGTPDTRPSKVLRLGADAVFVYGSSDQYMKTAIGVTSTATQYTVGGSIGYSTAYDVLNGKLIAASSGLLAHSTNGVSWTTAASLSNFHASSSWAWDGARYLIPSSGAGYSGTPDTEASTDLTSMYSDVGLVWARKDTVTSDVYGVSSTQAYERVASAWEVIGIEASSSLSGSEVVANAFAFACTSSSYGGAPDVHYADISAIPLTPDASRAMDYMYGSAVAGFVLPGDIQWVRPIGYFDGGLAFFASESQYMYVNNTLATSDVGIICFVEVETNFPAEFPEIAAAWGDTITGIPANNYYPARIFVPADTTLVSRRIVLKPPTNETEFGAYAEFYVGPTKGSEYDSDFGAYAYLGAPDGVYEVPPEMGDVWVVITGGGTESFEIQLQGDPFWTDFINSEAS